jgi:hypothetical protein
MVHSVQNSISTGRQIGTALTNPGKNVKEFFPEFVHNKHLMRRISVKKEALAKEGEVPVQKEEDNEYHLS